MTRVLVAIASRHGGTEELGRSIGATIADHGLVVDLQRIEDVEDVDRYDAFVVGSAVYMGAWLGSARAFVEAHREAIAARPTWLFSSGPIGKVGATDTGEPLDDLVEATKARDHHVFGGRLDRSLLTRRERLLAAALRAPEADEREWDAAVAWGTAIARTLTAAGPS